MTPSVFRKLDGTGIPVTQRYNYRPVPQDGIMRKLPAREVFAFAFNNATVNGANPLLSAVRRMGRSAGPSHGLKYENTERFIVKHAGAPAAA